jgi:hypothetical protein
LGIAHLPVGGDLIAEPFAEDKYVIVTGVGQLPSRQHLWSALEHLEFVEFQCSGARVILKKSGPDHHRIWAVRSPYSVGETARYLSNAPFMKRLLQLRDPRHNESCIKTESTQRPTVSSTPTRLNPSAL